MDIEELKTRLKNEVIEHWCSDAVELLESLHSKLVTNPVKKSHDENSVVAKIHVSPSDTYLDAEIEILDGSYFQRGVINIYSIGVEHECETCNGAGYYDERVGGEFFSNPRAKCPDC